MPAAPSTEAAIEFELGRAVLEDGQLALTGRWFGIRGRRFVRPTLTVTGGGASARFLADLADKPWAAEDGTEWRASFPIETLDAPPSEMELAVAPDIAVRLDAPRELRHRPVASASARRAAPAGGRLLDRAESAERGRSAARDERNAARAERDAAGAARSAALAARDTALAERDVARAERDAIRAERDALREERDAALEERDRALAERDTALAALADAGAGREQARAALERAEATLAALTRERDAAQAETGGLRDARDAARAELAELRRAPAATATVPHEPVHRREPSTSAPTVPTLAAPRAPAAAARAEWRASWPQRVIALGVILAAVIVLLLLTRVL